ncbi:MAG: toll/interleukin-1 receptor domain-containing protein [Ruminococcus sp.]|nr:toll/interleukin-1 receptor domain-containing protein [Ruminococcus sp.]
MVFSCKMCGANLDVQAGMRMCRCDYCDSVQTIPDLSSEHKAELFRKANNLRFACDFDRAYNVYKDIVADFPEEAEAWWGLCLCKYGVEYVTDPETNRRIPTCHRTSFEKILDIPEFRKVLEYSENNIRNVYIQLAETIDGIQQGILSIAVNEKPFDVFICYKETDEDGRRSADAMLAEKLYSELTAQNIKVFFAPVTLRDKLGTEFEPYIYSAINSAQIMLCVGTSAEHFDAVWVRNEWSRFIELMKKDRSKIIIPCYSEMSISGLPIEFRGFQAQDLTENNAFENVVKNVQDIMKASEGAKSQLNVLMEQFEGQLRNERGKLRQLESLQHKILTKEKKNAKKIYKKERISPISLFLLDILIVLSTLVLFMSFGGWAALPAILILEFIIILAVEVPYAVKRNREAKENFERRIAYDENAPDFDYGSQNSEIVQLREMAMKEYDKKHFTLGKTALLYIAGWNLAKLPIIYIVDIIDYLPIASDLVVAFFHLLLPVVGLVFIIRHNKKLKRELDEKLEIINKKNKI